MKKTVTEKVRSPSIETITSFSITCKRRVSMDIIYICLTKNDLVIPYYIYDTSKINLNVFLYLRIILKLFRVVLFEHLIIANIYTYSKILH